MDMALTRTNGFFFFQQLSQSLATWPQMVQASSSPSSAFLSWLELVPAETKIDN